MLLTLKINTTFTQSHSPRANQFTAKTFLRLVLMKGKWYYFSRPLPVEGEESGKASQSALNLIPNCLFLRFLRECVAETFPTTRGRQSRWEILPLNDELALGRHPKRRHEIKRSRINGFVMPRHIVGKAYFSFPGTDIKTPNWLSRCRAEHVENSFLEGGWELMGAH